MGFFYKAVEVVKFICSLHKMAENINNTTHSDAYLLFNTILSTYFGWLNAPSEYGILKFEYIKIRPYIYI